VTRRFFTAAGSADSGRLRWSRPRLIALDFDGTLAPLAATPQQARLEPGLRAVLRRLVRDPETSVALVSGRALNVLQAKVRLKGAFYIGNHGLTAEPAELGVASARVCAWSAVARRAEVALAPVIKVFPGCLL